MSECQNVSCPSCVRKTKKKFSTQKKNYFSIKEKRENLTNKMSDAVEDFLAREKDGLAGLENDIQAFQGEQKIFLSGNFFQFWKKKYWMKIFN